MKIRYSNSAVQAVATYRRSLLEPTPERVERVARALYAEFAEWDQLQDKDTWRGRARVAIAAIGE